MSDGVGMALVGPRVNDALAGRLNDALTLARDGLLDALDRTPRANWRQTVEMALIAVHGVGHSAGYRMASMDMDKKDAELAKPAPATPAGEDRALPDSKLTQAEIDEDVGHEFLREIARQLGRFSKAHDVTPGSLSLQFDIHNDPQYHGTLCRISINLKNVT